MLKMRPAPPRHNLPPQTTPFVGRGRELNEIARLLAEPDCRLLTLVGPGGIGKTRLALEAAAAQAGTFDSGVAFVSLEPVSSPDYLVSTLARSIDFDFFDRENPRQQLVDYLAELQILLLLDNFEHLLEGVAIVSEILAHAPGVKILATSRERLNLTSETVYNLDGLDFQGEDPLASEAARLFLQRARRLRPDLTLNPDDRQNLARICQLVGGMPLGILLAATWVQTLSLAEIADEIAGSLDFLAAPTRDIPERQRSIRAVFDQLWLRLSHDERDVFKKTAVFRGGFSRQAFESVTGASLRLLSALVDKSLLRRDDDGRYRIHELLRQYIQEHLQNAPDDEAQARRNHACYFANFLNSRLPGLTIGRPQATLEAIDEDIENIRAAWLTMAQLHMTAEIRQCATSLWYYCLDRFLTKEGMALFRQALNALEGLPADDPEINVTRAVLMVRQGTFYNVSGSAERGKAVIETALALFRAYGDQEQLMIGLMSLVDTLLSIHGWTQTPPGEVWDWSDGLNAAHEALAIARALGDSQSHATCLYLLGWIALAQRNYPEANRLGTEALALFRQTNNLWMVGAASGVLLGRVAEAEGRFDDSRRLRLESLRVAEEIGSKLDIGHNYAGLGYLAYLQQDYAEARRCYQHCVQLYTALPGNKGFWAMGGTLVNIAKLWAAQGRTGRAVELFAFVLASFRGSREPRVWATEAIEPLKSQLSPGDYEAALQRGQHLNLTTIVQEFLSESDTLAQTAAAPDQPDALTERELEIIALVAQGLSNREIAERLIFSIGTVKWYINQIFGKLHVSNRTQLVARARELGLIA